VLSVWEVHCGGWWRSGGCVPGPGVEWRTPGKVRGVWGLVTAYRSGIGGRLAVGQTWYSSGGGSGVSYGSQAGGVPSGRTYWRTRFPVRVRFTFRRRGRRGGVPPGHGRSPCGSAVCVGGAAGERHAWRGSAVMPATVVAVGVVVVPGRWSAGCRVCSGGLPVLPVGGASGGPVGVEIGGVLSSGEWLLSGTRGSGSGGSGDVGSRCRLRSVRSIGVPGPRDTPVSRGSARLSDPSVQQMEAARLVGSAGAGGFPRWQLGLSVGERVGSGHPWGSVSFSSHSGESAAPF
jgi:hypothetical protein